MNRATCFNYIEERLNVLSTRISTRGSLNILDMNLHAENFYAGLCNLVFNYEFVNANRSNQNMEGIDLIDKTNKVVAQVSATCTKNKIETSLNKPIYKEYPGYRYMFISISNTPIKNLKNKSFKNPYNMKFDPNKDIVDVAALLREINIKSIQEIRRIYDFIKAELGDEPRYEKMDTNLAYVVEILASQNLDIDAFSPEVNEFAIEDKINFNNLDDIRGIIDEYKIYYNKLDSIYSEFDMQGKNKSFSVLNEIRRQYIQLKGTGLSSVDIFYEIIENLMRIVQTSRNYQELPYEELQMCVDIIVVDAFIRCKIFENPKGYNHVITR